MKYSGGRFGFGVQRRIWEEVDRLGWRRGTLWLPYADLTFDIAAPIGHLPSWGRRGRLWSFFGSRIGQCGV
ncbi:MAG TPA: GUN4 domain-containing protein [Oscillatoriales cyanobacterium M59_W2019_021]|nr:GUN4 domain-containing protein [Oscillatoriales cyanobacterium M4454_W2019_049]HIK51307.1 GUN4 domain-containing protein [Oscillatoriales cyanobacterium M59_W2019_021]